MEKNFCSDNIIKYNNIIAYKKRTYSHLCNLQFEGMREHFSYSISHTIIIYFFFMLALFEYFFFQSRISDLIPCGAFGLRAAVINNIVNYPIPSLRTVPVCLILRIFVARKENKEARYIKYIEFWAMKIWSFCGSSIIR